MVFRSSLRIAFALTIVASCIGGLASSSRAAPERTVIPQSPSGPLSGYWSTDSTGHVVADGDAPEVGDLTGVHLMAPIVGIASTPRGKGFWLAAADGGVFTFGDARFYGSAGGLHLNAPVVGIASTPSGRGYWLVASDGGVFTYGDAKFHGSAGALHLNAPVVGIAPTNFGIQGYRLAASDGGVFTYGNATFEGSAGNLHLNAPVVGIATVGTHGYRLVASDGGVFTYGGASFAGTYRNGPPISAITTSPFGGYVLQQSIGGGKLAFGNAASCSGPVLPVAPNPSLPRFVGVASAYDGANPAVIEGAFAAVNCRIAGGTGAFHAGNSWRVRVAPNDPACSVAVYGLDHNSGQAQPLITQSGPIEMRSRQTKGHSVFEVTVQGDHCPLIAGGGDFYVQTMPFTTAAAGDTNDFSSPNPVTITADGVCFVDVHANSDGHLVKHGQGAHVMMSVPPGWYFVSNSTRCTVTIS